MIGIDLAVGGQAYVEAALKQGLLINSTHDHVLRLLPPFIVSERQVVEFLERFETVLAETRRPALLPLERPHTDREADGTRALAHVTY